MIILPRATQCNRLARQVARKLAYCNTPFKKQVPCTIPIAPYGHPRYYDYFFCAPDEIESPIISLAYNLVDETNPVITITLGNLSTGVLETRKVTGRRVQVLLTHVDRQQSIGKSVL